MYFSIQHPVSHMQHTCNEAKIEFMEVHTSAHTYSVYRWADIHSVWILLTCGPLSSPHALMATDLSLVFPLSLSDGFRRQNPLREQAVLHTNQQAFSQRLRHTHTDTRSITRWFQIQTSAANSFLFSCNYEGQFGSRLSSHIDRRSLIHT